MGSYLQNLLAQSGMVPQPSEGLDTADVSQLDQPVGKDLMAAAAPPRVTTQHTGKLKRMLSGGLSAMGEAMLNYAGVESDDEKEQRRATTQNIMANSAHLEALDKQMQSTVETPFGPMPKALAEKILPVLVRNQGQLDTTKARVEGQKEIVDLTQDRVDARQDKTLDAQWKRFMAGEQGKSQRSLRSSNGTFRAATDRDGNITGFYNTKNPNLTMRAPDEIGRTAAMSPERIKNSENASSGLRAIQKMRDMIKSDPGILVRASVPGSLGAREFSALRKEVADVITRLRTGAALNEEEQRFYSSQMPGLLDLSEPDAIDAKLDLVERLFNGLNVKGGKPAAPKPSSRVTSFKPE